MSRSNPTQIVVGSKWVGPPVWLALGGITRRPASMSPPRGPRSPPFSTSPPSPRDTPPPPTPRPPRGQPNTLLLISSQTLTPAPHRLALSPIRRAGGRPLRGKAPPSSSNVTVLGFGFFSGTSRSWGCAVLFPHLAVWSCSPPCSWSPLVGFELLLLFLSVYALVFMIGRRGLGQHFPGLHVQESTLDSCPGLIAQFIGCICLLVATCVYMISWL